MAKKVWARNLSADAPGPYCTRKRSVLTAVAVLICLAACVGTTRIAATGNVFQIENVPFIAQEDLQCGPAALATVINYWHRKGQGGRRVTVESVAAAIYSPSARGVLGFDLELYAQKLGFVALEPPRTIEAIRERIDGGLPVIVLVDYGQSLFQQNHFMVAKGYTEGGILFNSGRRENLVLSVGEFEKIWRRSGYWSLVIRP